MALGCGAQIIKLLLVILNIVVSLGSLGLIIIGSWFLADDKAVHFLGIANDGGSVHVARASAITVLVVGIFALLVGIAGCWGACREKTHCLNLYAVIIGLIVAVEIVAIILGGVYHSKITDNLKMSMNKTVQHDYGTLDPHNKTSAVTKGWDLMQYEMSCCGVEGPLDWQTSFWMKNVSRHKAPVPKTCCVLKNGNLDHPEPLNATLCYADVWLPQNVTSEFLHQKGCEPSLESWISGHIAVLIAVVVIVILVEVVVVLLACVLRARIKSGYEYV